MSAVTLTLPRHYPFTLRVGMEPHVGVWGLQCSLNGSEVLRTLLAEDGEYGPITEGAVARYQARVGMRDVDGIAGPMTQERIIRSIIAREKEEQRYMYPKNLPRSHIKGESSGFIAAVNWNVPGGVDVSYFGRRVYDNRGLDWGDGDHNWPQDANFDQRDIELAFDARYQTDVYLRTLVNRITLYEKRVKDYEYAVRLAVLAHNFWYAADRLSAGLTLSNNPASWIPKVKFDDGEPVVGNMDWCEWYALGSKEHEHHGKMLELVTSFEPV